MFHDVFYVVNRVIQLPLVEIAPGQLAIEFGQVPLCVVEALLLFLVSILLFVGALQEPVRAPEIFLNPADQEARIGEDAFLRVCCQGQAKQKAHAANQLALKRIVHGSTSRCLNSARSVPISRMDAQVAPLCALHLLVPNRTQCNLCQTALEGISGRGLCGSR